LLARQPPYPPNISRPTRQHFSPCISRPPQQYHTHTSRFLYTSSVLKAVPMAFAQTWLAAVCNAGDADPLPDPQIPADYLQKPQRQHPASAQSSLPPNYRFPLTSSIETSDRKRTALTEIDPSNDPQTHKRQRVPNQSKSLCAMPQTPQSLSKTSSRIAARRLEDTRSKVRAAEYGVDLNATPRPGRAARNTAPDLPNPSVPVPALPEANIPE
jgi:hypothetical protein